MLSAMPLTAVMAVMTTDKYMPDKKRRYNTAKAVASVSKVATPGIIRNRNDLKSEYITRRVSGIATISLREHDRS